MGSKLKIIAIIPAHNEARTIGKIITETKKYIKDVIVIDDASTDNTYKVAEEAGALVLRHVYNMGVGGALLTGYKFAFRKEYDIIVQLDGDGQHLPKEIPKLLEVYEKGYDIVIGSRFLNLSYKKYPLIRKAGIIFFSILNRLYGKADIKDITSGYRIYNVQSLKKLAEIPAKHWAIEQTFEACKKRLKIKEVSVKMPVRRKGKSQFNLRTYIFYPLRAIEKIIRVILWR